MDKRHDMSVYGVADGDTTTQYINVSLPGLGEVTLTYETRSYMEPDDGPHLVVSVTFPVGKIDIIDSRGNDRKVDHR